MAARYTGGRLSSPELLDAAAAIDIAAFSPGGTLAYIPSPDLNRRSLVWITPEGTASDAGFGQRDFWAVSLSPDGRRAAIARGDGPDAALYLADANGGALTMLTKRPWIFLGICVLFLLSYTGFIGWGKGAQALEHLADQPAVRGRFATPIGRGEAIVTSFLFVLLTPMALAAFGGLVAFTGAITAGFLRMIVPLRDLPQWIFLGVAYLIYRTATRSAEPVVSP